MQYRDYGRTGIKVSALGYGAMRLPKDDEEAISCMVRGLELGINYIDTAYGYNDGWSETMVGKAAKRFGRGKVFIATKNPMHDDTKDGWWKRLERSLEYLDTSYIDFLKVVHALSWEAWERINKPGGMIEAIIEAKDQGLYHHPIFSCHDSPENMMKLIDTGFFEGILLQYNLLDRRNEDVIAHAAEMGMGVEVMGPVGGGRLGMSSEKLESLASDVKSTPELALRFVLANPNVSVAFSGMSNMEQVEENCATASREDALSAEELESIEQALRENQRLAELYCTGCNYCMPCPQKVGIPQAFAAMNMHKVWGLTEHAKHMYRRLGPNHREGLLQADACIECGKCEEKCPQNIPIMEQLKETHAALGGE
jgi:hypothetical protein